jgi:hypothetical protein
MPQFDFRQLFPSSPTETHPRKESRGTGDELTDQHKFIPPLQLSREHWTNIAFVVAACLGALLSAVYFFNGAELFRQAAMWPGELLYSPPRSPVRTYPTNATPQPSSGQTIGGTSSNANPAATNSGDPFSSASRLLNLTPTSPLSNVRSNTASSSTGPATPQATSLLRQLGLPAPGGDALSKALTEGPINSAQTNLAGAKNIAAAAQGRSQRGVSSRVKNAMARTRSARAATGTSVRKLGSNVKSATQSTVQSTSATASTAARSDVGQAGSGLKTSMSAAQQLRTIGGAGAINAGGGHILGHAGGR